MKNIITKFGLVLIGSTVLLPQVSYAWGASGHRMVSTAGIKSLPDNLPSFLRTDNSAAIIGELGREPDRSKGSGKSHDRDLDPGHYLNLGDDGLIANSVAITALPDSRENYDTALRAKGSDEYQAGFLPYSIIDGWQQLRKDFAYWRADKAGIKYAKSIPERQWFEHDQQLHEILILRDTGYWSHFVADASQPLHVTTHFNGWGEYDNPGNFLNAKSVHADFEGSYVSKYIQLATVMNNMPQPKVLGCEIEQQTANYLIATNKQVVPFYQLINSHPLSLESREVSQFAISRLAAGAAELRDLIMAAWQCSLDMTVGFPPVSVEDIESGHTNPIHEMGGLD